MRDICCMALNETSKNNHPFGRGCLSKHFQMSVSGWYGKLNLFHFFFLRFFFALRILDRTFQCTVNLAKAYMTINCVRLNVFLLLLLLRTYHHLFDT